VPSTKPWSEIRSYRPDGEIELRLARALHEGEFFDDLDVALDAVEGIGAVVLARGVAMLECRFPLGDLRHRATVAMGPTFDR